MFCTKCGTQLSDDSRFCYKCGAPTHLAEQKDSIGDVDYDRSAPAVTPTVNNPAPQPQAQPAATDDGIFGLLGFILAFFVPLIGLILCLIGFSKKKNNGLALAGFIIALISIVLIIVATIVNDRSLSYLLFII